MALLPNYTFCHSLEKSSLIPVNNCWRLVHWLAPCENRLPGRVDEDSPALRSLAEYSLFYLPGGLAPTPRSLATNSKSCAAMAPSCLFFWAWWLLLLLAVTAAQEQVEGCSGSPNRCGNVPISDPFWLIDWQPGRSCGSPDFEVACLNNTPVLRSAISYSFGFEIMDISYEEESMHVVDLEKLRLLPNSNSCNEPIWNTSERLGRRFRIDPVNLNLIIYNCTNASAAAARRDGELVETTMRCGNESSVFVRPGGRYNSSGNYEGYYLDGCTSNSVPVLGTSGKANAQLQAAHPGWLPPDMGSPSYW